MDSNLKETGDTVVFTLSNNTGINVSYNITGVTSIDINNALLTDVVSYGTATTLTYNLTGTTNASMVFTFGGLNETITILNFTEYLIRKNTTNTTYKMSTDGGSTWTENPQITFEANQTYTFDQSNSTNSGEQIVFGTTFDDKANILGTADGVTVVGTPGSSGAYTQLILGASFSGDLLYYSAGSNGMGYSPPNFLYDSNISTDPKTISQTLDFSSDFTVEIQFTPYSNTRGFQLLFGNDENFYGTEPYFHFYIHLDKIKIYAKNIRHDLVASFVLNENNTLIMTRSGNNITYMLNNVNVAVVANSDAVEFLGNFTSSKWAAGRLPSDMIIWSDYPLNGRIYIIKKDGIALSFDT